MERSLDVLGRLGHTDDRGAQTRLATEEVQRLRWILDGNAAEPDPLTRALWGVAADSAARGLPVELLTREVVAAVDPPTCSLVCRCVDSALGVLAQTSGVARSIVRVRTTEDGSVAVTVRARRPVSGTLVPRAPDWEALVRSVCDVGGDLSGPHAGVTSDPEWRLVLPLTAGRRIP